MSDKNEMKGRNKIIKMTITMKNINKIMKLYKNQMSLSKKNHNKD